MVTSHRSQDLLDAEHPAHVIVKHLQCGFARVLHFEALVGLFGLLFLITRNVDIKGLREVITILGIELYQLISHLGGP